MAVFVDPERPRRTQCCCTSGASSHSSDCRCSCAPTRGHGRASCARRRSSSGVGIRANGKASIRSRWPAPAGAEDVFSGWRGHDELPAGLRRSRRARGALGGRDLRPVYLEAMACGLPVVATPTGGPLSFVNTVPGRPNGWFVEPDDEAALTGTLIEVVNDAAERRARGPTAYEQIRGGLCLGHDRDPCRLAVRRRARHNGQVPSLLDVVQHSTGHRCRRHPDRRRSMQRVGTGSSSSSEDEFAPRRFLDGYRVELIERG